MQDIFILIRLPFFIIGFCLWALFGLAVAQIIVILGGLLFLGVIALWVCVLFPGSILMAAFMNDDKLVPRFLKSSWSAVKDIFVTLKDMTLNHFKGYRKLGLWLIGDEDE